MKLDIPVIVPCHINAYVLNVPASEDTTGDNVTGLAKLEVKEYWILPLLVSPKTALYKT